MTTAEQPVDPVLDELVRECADRVSRSVRVTGPPNMETCEDLPNAFAYWEKDSLHKIIRKAIDKAIAAKADAVPRTPNLDDLATECAGKVINASPIKAREVIGDALLQCVVQYNPASWHIARALEKQNAQLESIADIVRVERDEYRNSLEKINELRNSMVAMQGFNFSEHLDPLAATLNAVGIEGMDYPEALENFGTMLERTNKAQAESAGYQEAMEGIRECFQGALGLSKDQVLESVEVLAVDALAHLDAECTGCGDKSPPAWMTQNYCPKCAESMSAMHGPPADPADKQQEAAKEDPDQ